MQTAENKISEAELGELSRLAAAQQYPEVEALSRKWIAQFPHEAFGWFVCGSALQRQERFAEAISFLRQAVALSPRNAAVLNDLGNAFTAVGRYKDAENALSAALRQNPDYAEAHYNLGLCLMAQGQQTEAEKQYRHAIDIKPHFAEAHNNLGTVLEEQGRLPEAEASLRRALSFNPELCQAHNALGSNAKHQGYPADAIDHFRRALKLNPEYEAARNNLLLTLNYFSDRSEEMLCEARAYGEWARTRVVSVFTAWKPAENNKRLKVGFVSGDFCNHPVGYFLDGVVACLAGSSIDLFLYSTQDEGDELTSRLKGHATALRSLKAIPDMQAAAMIHNDGIQVLIDLAGHTNHNRLPVFAWKPAPVQAAWLGYFATTGLQTIDYFMTDRISVPESSARQFIEKIWYLPTTRLCFTPPAMPIDVVPSPAGRNGYPTIGCFQSMSKISEPVLAAWSRILAANKAARLRLQCSELGNSDVRAALAARLGKHGIDNGRVSMIGHRSRENYLASHAEADLILDTFPYPGGTTTCEALWMGVPTLTLAQATGSFLSRQGASILSAAQMNDWITGSESEYVARALDLLGNISAWSNDRLALRDRLLRSPLFDCRKFAQDFEKSLWAMWETHCETATAGQDANPLRSVQQPPAG